MNCNHQSSGFPSEQKYVNLLTDSGFKAVFGDKENKELIMDFLNAVLDGERVVTDIEFLPGELEGKTVTSKGIRFDLFCKDGDGHKFVVEMQRYPHSKNFFQRSIYYGAKAYETQAVKGMVDYSLQPVYVIGIMENALEHEKPSMTKRVVSRYKMVETDSRMVAPSTINCIFVQLHYFNLRKEDCKTGFDRWCYSFKNASRQVENPFSDKISQELFLACEIALFSAEKRLMYDKDMMTELDYSNDMTLSRAEGKAEGLVEGEARGRAEVASNMKSLGIDIEIICKATGLSKEEVQVLA